MIILTSSKISQSNIQGSLGKPEYSYFFLMMEFLPLLERIAKVIQVKNREEIESLFAKYSQAGEQVVFLSFSPPHQVPLGLGCTTICVFAWEFDTLPNRTWDRNPANNWHYVFDRIQGAITTSKETAQLVIEATHGKLPVIALPAPVWDKYANLGNDQGYLPDTHERSFQFVGTVIDSPILGLSADGLVRKPEPAAHSVVDPEPQICAPVIEPQVEKLVIEPPLHNITVKGIVYTTVLNPADGRKNWIDLITAFCWAFKTEPNATLIVKITHHDLDFYRVVLMTLLSRLAPFQCRVIVLHGFLEHIQYTGLIKASNYYVNASSGEGLCMPLMEFLSSAKPVIAPRHTAMADYIDEQVAFLVQCSPEPSCWPHDPTGMLYTHRHRLNWQSLMESFHSSYEVATKSPEQYMEMSKCAFTRMLNFASIHSTEKALETFLVITSSSTSTGSHVLALSS